VTRDVLEKYVANLSREAQSLFRIANYIFNELGDYDTLCDEFQIACGVLDASDRQCKQSQGDVDP